MLTPDERRRVRATSGCAEQTVLRWERDEPIREASRIRIDDAVKQLINKGAA